MSAIPAQEAPAPGHRFALVISAITFLALVLRAAFFLGAEIDVPIRGDGMEYWKYAWNLVQHGVFSQAAPAEAAPAPDSYRSPGYPAFLALCQWLTDGHLQALALAQWLQILLGTALVPLTIGLGRRWLPMPWALAAGLAVAVWPHLVVFSSTLLSETLFAFAILLALASVAHAQARDDARLAALAGALAGLATLVNPLLALLPPVVAAVLALRGQRRCAVAYVLLFALVNGAWAWRNAGLESGAGSTQRAQTNLVQGSWPLYLQAWNDRHADPGAAAYFQQVAEQTAKMHAQPRAALADMGARFATQPLDYLHWYLVDKPLLLWGWGIRVGWGDIYFLETRRSPYERYPALRVLRAACLALNPIVLALAVWGALAALWPTVRRRWPAGHAAAAPNFAALLASLFFFYVTALHAVLQGEPRYAVAYRPIELLLAASALALVAGLVRARRARPA